jgi:hypothetical protein
MTQGLADIFKKDRKQEILTPDFILEPIIKIWGGIALDPCGSKQNIFADKTTFENEEDGLLIEWVDKTYVNPPYKNLQEWMQKMEDEMESDSSKSIVMLCPARSHRKWWRKLASKCIIVLLPQMAFKGYKQKFPVPMCMLLHGRYAHDVASKYEDSLVLNLP